MRFLLDNNLSPKLAAVLRALEHDVAHLKEHFAEDAEDVDWIPMVAAQGWTVITVDHAIRSRPVEREVWRMSKIRVFFSYPSGSATYAKGNPGACSCAAAACRRPAPAR